MTSSALDRLDAEYGRDPERGGAAGWMRVNGLDDALLARLRARLTAT